MVERGDGSRYGFGTTMPSTHTHLLHHVIFATKNREPLIFEPWRSRLHGYLGGCVRGLDGTPDAVGGVADHVHLLVGLKPTHCLADFMREMKKSSSTWAQHVIPGFGWQEGYAAFSVSASARGTVRDYIRRQEAHHRQTTFREELVEFLTKTGMPFDERYL